MPTFHYTARSRGGDIVNGSLEAATEAEARERLRASQYDLLDLSASAADIAAQLDSRPLTVEGFLAEFPDTPETAPLPQEPRYAEPDPDAAGRGRRGVVIPTRDLADIYRSLAAMLRTGVPILQAIQGLRMQTRNPVLARALLDMEAAALYGRPISEAMARHPRAFGRGHVGLVRAGEGSGRLPVAFTALADQMDADWSVQAALRWNPLLFLVRWVATPLLVVLFVAVFPLRSSVAGGHPGLAIVRVVVALAMLVMVMMLAYPVLDAVLRRLPGGGALMDRLGRLPLVGARRSRFERVHTLGALVAGLEAGIPLSMAWDLATDATESDRARRAMAAQGGRIRRGAAISDALAATELYDETVVQAARYGEYTGNLPESLKEIIAYDRKEAALIGGLTPWVVATLAYFLYLLVGAYLVLHLQGL